MHSLTSAATLHSTAVILHCKDNAYIRHAVHHWWRSHFMILIRTYTTDYCSATSSSIQNTLGAHCTFGLAGCKLSRSSHNLLTAKAAATLLSFTHPYHPSVLTLFLHSLCPPFPVAVMLPPLQQKFVHTNSHVVCRHTCKLMFCVKMLVLMAMDLYS